MIEKTNRIGFGLLKPLRRQHNDFAGATGSDLLKSCVETIVNTPASGFSGKIAGTYPWRMNFGSWVSYLRHNNMHGYKEDLASVYAAESIASWEPRVEVQLNRSGIVPGTATNESRIRIYFGVADQLGGDIKTGSLEETYHEVVV